MSESKPNICKYSHIFVILSGKVKKMLVNLLSQKSFLLQFFLGALFLALFLLGLSPIRPDLYSISAILLLLLTAVVCLLFYNYSNLVKSPGFGLWFYLIWILMFSKITTDLPMTTSLLFCSLIFWRWISATNPAENRMIMFESGFLLAVSALFYPPSIFLIVFVLVAYFYTQTLNLRGLLLLIIGLSLPVLITAQILYLTGHFGLIDNYFESFYLNFWNVPVWTLIPFGLLILFSWMDHLTKFATQNIYKRHKYFLIFIYFVNWMIILALYGGNEVYSLMFLGFPISIFLSRFVQYASTAGKKEFWLWLFAVFAMTYIFEDELIQLYDSVLGDVSFQL